MRKFNTNPTEPRLTLVSNEYHSPQNYRCLACSGTSEDHFSLCPGCGALDACVPIEDERGPDPTVETRKRARNARFIETRKLAFLSTGRPAWDKVLGGGVVRASSILVAGRKGAGKSTAALGVAMHVGREMGGPVLYASAEMPEDRVMWMAARIGLSRHDLGRLWVNDSKELGDIVADVDELGPAVVVWDSIQRFRVEGRLGDRELVDVVSTALERGAAHEAVTLLLSQVTKDGTPVGPSGIAHDADVEIWLRRTRGGRVAIECPEKNRFAPVPLRALEGAPPKRRRRRRASAP